MKITLKSYIIGFTASLALTFAAAWLAWADMRSGGKMLSWQSFYGAVIGLAIVQLVIQLVFFMHLAGEKGPRWRLVAFVSTAGIILIIVAGSVWIMNHLNYNMMASPAVMEKYIQSQDGI